MQSNDKRILQRKYAWFVKAALIVNVLWLILPFKNLKNFVPVGVTLDFYFKFIALFWFVVSTSFAPRNWPTWPRTKPNIGGQWFFFDFYDS